jgi:hypothetical protein
MVCIDVLKCRPHHFFPHRFCNYTSIVEQQDLLWVSVEGVVVVLLVPVTFRRYLTHERSILQHPLVVGGLGHLFSFLPHYNPGF